MTTAQITNIIVNELGHSVNQIIHTPEIAIISSDLDGPIYPGNSTRLCFNTSAENLEIYYGNVVNGEYVFRNEGVPSYIIPFLNIYGITLAGPLHQPEPYKFGKAV